MLFKVFKVKVMDIDLNILFEAIKLSKNILHPFKYGDIIFFYYKTLGAHFSVEKIGDVKLLVTVDLPYVTEYMIMKVKRELRTLYVMKILMNAVPNKYGIPEYRLAKPVKIRYNDKLIFEFSQENKLKIAYNEPYILSEVTSNIDKTKIYVKEIHM
jgi:hypothetical protein